MTNEQFTAFCVLLAAISLPSVSLWCVLAWDLWRYGTARRPAVFFLEGVDMNDTDAIRDSNAIRDAIKRSKASGQIQKVSVELTADALKDLLLRLPALVRLGTDWEMTKIEDNKVDVWGWSDGTPEGDQDWRLWVQCVAND